MPLAIATATAPTAGGTPQSQAITIDCKGQVPKAVLIACTRATALNTVTDGAMISLGFSDGTTTRLASAMAEDNIGAGTADTGVNYDNDATIIRILATTSEAIDGEATLTSLTANTVTVSWIDLPTTAVQIVVYALWGSGMQAATGSINASTTLDGVATSSAFTFRPRGIIFVNAYTNFLQVGALADMHVGFGALNSDGTVQGQGGLAMRQADRASPTVCHGGIRNDSVSQKISTTAEEARYELTGGDADSFDITTRVAGGFTHTIGFIAFDPGGRCSAGSFDLNTDTTGNKDVTVQGIPVAAFMVGSGLTTINAYSTAAPNANWSIGGAFSGSQACVGYQAEDGAATSDTRCITDTGHLIRVIDDDATTIWSASFVSLQSGSFTVNVDDASASDMQALFLAWEEPPDMGWLAEAKSGSRWRRRLARM